MWVKFKRAMKRPVDGQLIKVTSPRLSRNRNVILAICAVLCAATYQNLERVVSEDLQHSQRQQNRPTNETYSDAWKAQHRKNGPRLKKPDTHKVGAIRLKASNPEEARALTSKVAASGTRQGLFIPLAWLEKRETDYFAGSDPEWQEFVKLSKDKKHCASARSVLCNAVVSKLDNLNQITRVTGQPLQVGRVWLDFRFPSSPPPEYERLGLICWSDGGFAGNMMWAYKRYDAEGANRLSAIFLPTALFSSMVAMGRSILTSHYGSLKSLGAASGIPHDKKPAPETGPDSGTAVKIRDQSNLNTAAGKEKLRPATTPDLDQSLGKIISSPAFNIAISNAAKSFNGEFANKWAQQHRPLPRGGCLLVGEVEVRGPQGYCKLSVRSIYTPHDRQFQGVLIAAPYLTPFKQGPVKKSVVEKTSKP